MRRLAVVLASAAVTLGAAVPAAHARSDDATKPVVLLSGGERAGVDCESQWERMILHLRKLRLQAQGRTLAFTGGFQTVTSYDTDSRCDVVLSGGGAKGLEGQARDFATWLKTKGQTVDVVAHGTGGLVLRYALAMAEQGAPGWPAPLPVEDAITLGTPHGGSAAIAAACPGRQLCQELDPESAAGKAMLAKLATAPFTNPQGQGGTDWTAIAAAKDELVTAESALAMDAAHETTFHSDKLNHLKLLSDISTARDATVTYQHRGTDVVEWRKAPHVAERVGLNLVFGSDGNLSGPTGPKGCTGSTDVTGGAVIVRFPGLTGWKGSADMSYIKSGILEAYANCFKKGPKATLTSDGTVRLNGLDIVPAPGQLITIDPAKRRVTAAKMSMSIPSKWFGGIAVPIMQDTDLDWILPKEAGALQGDDVDGWKVSGGGKVFGLKLKGSLKLSLSQGASNLEGTVALPGFFKGKVPAGDQPECGNGKDDDDDGRTDTQDDNCASATDNYEDAADNPGLALAVRSDNVSGLQVDKVSGTIEGNIKIGRFSLPSATISYSAPDNTWSGGLSTVIPWFTQPKISVALALKDGKLQKFEAEGDGLGIPLTTPLILQRAKFAIAPDPFELTVGGTVSVGPRSPFFGKRSAAPVEVDGEFTASGSGVKVAAKVFLLADEWGNASIDIKSTGVTLAGEIGREFEVRRMYGANRARIKTSLKAKVGGVIDGTGLDINGKAEACFEGELKLTFYTREQERTCLGEAGLRMSGKKGLVAFTVCGQADLGPWSGSFGWGARSARGADGSTEFTADVIAGSCDVDSWHTAPASASQAPGGGRSLSIGSNLDAAVFGIEGNGAPPHVALRGPGGAGVPAPASASGIVRGEGYMLIHSPADNTTYAIVAKPKGGRWTVEPQPGSAAIAELRSADALPQPSVTAKLARVRGGKQRLRYDVKPIPGQAVRFREIGGGAVATVGKARGTRGTLTFRPAFGRGGTRKIVAVVEQRGLPRAELTVARYSAPRPRTLAAPRRVTLRRSGERMTVAWKPVAGAVRYVVEVATGDGRALMYEVKRRQVVVKRMLGDAASRVTVRAVRADDKLGRARTVRGGN